MSTLLFTHRKVARFCVSHMEKIDPCVRERKKRDACLEDIHDSTMKSLMVVPFANNLELNDYLADNIFEILVPVSLNNKVFNRFSSSLRNVLSRMHIFIIPPERYFSFFVKLIMTFHEIETINRNNSKCNSCKFIVRRSEFLGRTLVSLENSVRSL